MRGLFNQRGGKDTMGEELQVRFSHERVKSVLDGTLTIFEVKAAKYEVGKVYTAIDDETGEEFGTIRILSRKKVYLFEANSFWRYEFVLELSREDEEALKRRLEALGYI